MGKEITQCSSHEVNGNIENIYLLDMKVVLKADSVEESLIFYVKEIYPVNNEIEKVIMFENGMDYVPWEVMLPSSHEELRKIGYVTMADIDDKYVLSQNSTTKQASASYVSQALCEGGIPTDSEWKPYSGAWTGVKALTDYMSDNGYWARVSYGILQRGDIIKFSGESHVVMITYFDGTTSIV